MIRCRLIVSVCTCDTGFSKVDMYSGGRSFKKRNIAATSLKIVCKNIYSVKCLYKTNLKVFCIIFYGKKIAGA